MQNYPKFSKVKVGELAVKEISTLQQVYGLNGWTVLEPNRWEYEYAGNYIFIKSQGNGLPGLRKG